MEFDSLKTVHNFAPQGRRKFEPKESSWNFLKNEHLEAFNRVEAVKSATASHEPLKFKNGFARKPASAIGVEEQRHQKEYYLEQRAELWHERKHQRSIERSNPHGNIIVGGDAMTFREKKTGRKHTDSEKGPMLMKEDVIRTRASEARFFQPAPEPTVARYNALRQAQMRQQATTVLGAGGRKDIIPSMGVADNFIGMKGFQPAPPPPKAPPPPIGWS